MLEVRDRKCREHFGEDVWDKAESKVKACFDFLCGNHTRNLPVVRFNKVIFIVTYTIIPRFQIKIPCLVQAYESWIEKELGEALRVAKMATGDLVFVRFRV